MLWPSFLPFSHQHILDVLCSLSLPSSLYCLFCLFCCCYKQHLGLYNLSSSFSILTCLRRSPFLLQVCFPVHVPSRPFTKHICMLKVNLQLSLDGNGFLPKTFCMEAGKGEGAHWLSHLIITIPQ